MGEIVPFKFKPKTVPRDYQAEALRRAFACGGRYGLFLKPRTGKSKIAIDFAAASFLQDKVKRVLIVCQFTGWTVWEQELAKHCSVPYRLIMLPRGSKNGVRALRSIKTDNHRLTFVLVNYEATWRIEEGLFRWAPELMICDEAHKIKNRNAKQSRCIHRLVQVLDPYRILLTGTPIANSPLDVFSQYMVIDDAVFGRRWSAFEQRYAIRYGFYNRKVRYKNLGDLRRRARTKATVLTREECLDLPPRSYDIVPVDLTETSWKKYDQMAEDFITFLEDGETASASIKLTQMLRLSQMTSGFVTTESHKIRRIGSEKLDALKDLLEELVNSGEKVVVFARFRPDIEAIEKLCQRNRWKSWKYYGPVSGERMYYPQKFDAHKGPAVFIAQTATGALSIELAAAAYAIFYSFDYSMINWEQCHDRLHGPAQTKKVSYQYLIARGTVDEEIYRVLESKEGVASLLNNNPNKIVFPDSIL